MPIIIGTSSAETLTGGSDADEIFGLGGSDTLNGGGGNDILIGGAGNDTLTGDAGNDTFAYDTRDFGSDTITDFQPGDRIDVRGFNVGTAAELMRYATINGTTVTIETFFDGTTERITVLNTNLAAVQASLIVNTSAHPLLVTGTISRDVLFGGNGADQLFGYNGNDQLNGGLGNDVLDGGYGDDTLSGGGSADRFVFGYRYFGSDTIVDLAGLDRIDVRGLNVGVATEFMRYATSNGPDVTIETFFGGTTERITVLNANLATVQSALLVNTSLDPLLVTGTNSNDVLFGGSGSDQLFGNNGNDQLNGGLGNDVLDGGSGNDILRGGGSADRFVYAVREFGSDTIVDLVGLDRIDVRGFNVGTAAELMRYATVNGPDVSIETFFGGSTERITVLNANLATVQSALLVNTSVDPLLVTGTNSNDVLFGGSGSDQLFGNNGDDQLNGGLGNDVLDGGSGNDILRGGGSADRFVYAVREFGSDTIVDLVGLDRIDVRGFKVGNAAELMRYATVNGSDVSIETFFGGSTERITVLNANLATVQAALLVDTSVDPLLVTGTNSRDVLFGGNGADQLFGYNGDDQLNGGLGNDILVGGYGVDQLRGGGGSDWFRFFDGDSLLGAQRDLILDFSRAQGDKIDLRPIDPSESYGDQPLAFISGAFSAIGQIRVNAPTAGTVVVEINLDADPDAEMQIAVASNVALVAADFLL